MWFIISGRACGQDEDSTYIYYADTRVEAEQAFIDDMRNGAEKPEGVAEDEDVEGWTVFVNSIVSCETEPKFA